MTGEFRQDFRYDDRIVVDTEHRSCGRVAHQIYHDALFGKQAIYCAEVVLGDKGQIFGAELNEDLVFLQDEVRYLGLWAVYTTNGSSWEGRVYKALDVQRNSLLLKGLNGLWVDDRGTVKCQFNGFVKRQCINLLGIGEGLRIPVQHSWHIFPDGEAICTEAESEYGTRVIGPLAAQSCGAPVWRRAYESLYEVDLVLGNVRADGTAGLFPLDRSTAELTVGFYQFARVLPNGRNFLTHVGSNDAGGD